MHKCDSCGKEADVKEDCCGVGMVEKTEDTTTETSVEEKTSSEEATESTEASTEDNTTTEEKPAE